MSPEDIIREAESVSELTIKELMTDKFDSELACALYTLTLDGYTDDMSSEENGGEWVARIDRYLVIQTEDGSVKSETYDHLQFAMAAMDETRALHNGERDV